MWLFLTILATSQGLCSLLEGNEEKSQVYGDKRRSNSVLFWKTRWQGVVGLYWKPATLTIPVSWAVCHWGCVFNAAAVYWSHCVSHSHRNTEQIHSYLGGICCRCSPSLDCHKRKRSRAYLSWGKISPWSLHPEKAIKGNLWWVCFFPKWKIDMKL